MARVFRSSAVLVGVLAWLTFFNAVGYAQARARTGQQSRALITQPINEGAVIALRGNTRPEANALNDRGAVADDFQMEHLLLQLRRPPEQEQALRQFVDELHNPASPNFHHWLSPQEFGEKFGLAQEDLDAITTWLQAHGFAVNVVYPSGVLIDFSGSAGQVREAFRTEIHSLEVKGERHIANMSDPQIPAALAPAVAGIVSLHDFKPRVMHKLKPNYTTSSGYQLVAPADLATIYNLNPLFQAGYSGQGQTIVVIEDTDVYTTADWSTFRSTFGLSGYAGSFSQIHPAPPSGTNNCTDPGYNGNDGEAILDAEWASAAAPSASIELASCSDSASFGGLIALQNLINESSTPPALVSISYGECEAENGATANAAYNSTYQQAVAEGVSVFVSAGDEGAASCDAGQSTAKHGIGVSGFASTPYNVAVGGTDFGDSYAGSTATYWNTSNTATYGSAKSYIPEIPWNDSCASVLIATYYGGSSTTYGSSGFCNSSMGSQFRTVVSGSGGPSGCATGNPATSGVVGGSCAGYAKPSWQSVFGNPSDGARDIPDLSLFAANGRWGHYYVFCDSDTGNDGAACTGAPSGWSGAGGTSFSSPIMAGIQALVNQFTASSWGNPNSVYYQLATSEYGASGNSSCNSSNGNAASTSCVFYDVTQGDMDVNCTGSHNCYKPSGSYGVLSTSNGSYSIAYGTTAGWDFATGIGTVNAYNLVHDWSSGVVAPTPGIAISSLSSSSVALTVGGSAQNLTVNLTRTDFTGSITLGTSTLPSGVSASITQPGTGNSGSISLTAAAGATTGTSQITITASGSGVTSATANFSLTVNPTASIAISSLSSSSITLTDGGSAQSLTVNLTRTNFTGSITLGTSTLPSGVSASITQPGTGNSGSISLTAAAGATTGTSQITITASGTGVSSATANFSLTVNPAASIAISSLSPASLSISRGGSAKSVSVSLTRTNYTGSITLSTSTLPNGVSATITQPNTSSSGSISLKASSRATLTSNRTITVTAKGSGVSSATANFSLTVTASGSSR